MKVLFDSGTKSLPPPINQSQINASSAIGLRTNPSDSCAFDLDILGFSADRHSSLEGVPVFASPTDEMRSHTIGCPVIDGMLAQ